MYNFHKTSEGRHWITRIIAPLIMAAVVFILPLDASAAGITSQDGLNATISTDKASYTAEEDINLTITVKNNNTYAVEDVSIEGLLPEGLQLKTGSLEKEINKLDAGEELTISAVAVLKDESATQLNTTTQGEENNNNSDSPKGGISTNIIILSVLLVLLVIGIILTIKHRKKATKYFSMFLCMALLLSGIPLGTYAANQEDQRKITLSTTFLVDDQSFTIGAGTSYLGNDNMRVDTSTDTDGDKLPDYIESVLGSDPTITDTDGDGLVDGVEFELALDPTLIDTDGNGITDANEDTDDDGLTNINEITVGLNPGNVDTDNDGLTDGEEVKTYQTNPLNADTDQDTLSDYEEVQLGLNPNTPKTDGVTDDALRTFNQTLGQESISELLTSSDNSMIPSISGDVPGLISNRVRLEQDIITSFDNSTALVSPIVEVQTTYNRPLTLSFDFSISAKDYERNTNNLVVVEFNGTDLDIIDTDVNILNEVISAEISGEGTYFVIDLDEFLKSIGIDVFGNSFEASEVIAENFNTSENVGEVTNSGEWIVLDDYQAVKIEGALSEGKDTDKDGLSDRAELNSSYEKDLTEFIQALLDLNSLPKDMYNGITSITVWSYESNPILTDTDFDGINDERDSSPKDNSFKGELNYNRSGKKLASQVEFSVDYRNFFNNSQNYSEEISVWSSLLAADIYGNSYVYVTEGAEGGSDDPTSFGTLLGLSDVEDIKIEANDYDVDKDDLTEIVIGHRLVEYKGEQKEIIIISVRGTNGTNAEWSSNFDVGADTSEYYNATGSNHPDWINRQYNHKGFDVASNRVLDKIDSYLQRHGLSDTVDKSILTVGHSRGAGIANLLGAHFENDPSVLSYTYTFAAPNTTTDPDVLSYQTVFNVVNKDDIITALPLATWGFTKYGTTKEISVEDFYENKWGQAEKGTFEWLVGSDYDNDGGTERTLSYFAKIAKTREELYVLDSSNDGKVWEDNLGHITRAGAEKELAELTIALENEKLLKFCKLSIVGGGFLSPYHVEINYNPAYFMQSLANITTGVGPLIGRDVNGKYAVAKASFIASSGQIPYVPLGGMEDPHLPITYYLIAYNNFERI